MILGMKPFPEQMLRTLSPYELSGGFLSQRVSYADSVILHISSIIWCDPGKHKMILFYTGMYASHCCHIIWHHMGSWWRHQTETFSALLALCAGNSPVTGKCPSQRPLARSLDVFFNLRLNKRLSKQLWGWWFETPSRPLWRHCNGFTFNSLFPRLSKIQGSGIYDEVVSHLDLTQSSPSNGKRNMLDIHRGS